MRTNSPLRATFLRLMQDRQLMANAPAMLRATFASFLTNAPDSTLEDIADGITRFADELNAARAELAVPAAP